jgi:hypothetical protein
MNELANGVMSGSTDISITATRSTAQTDLNLQIVAGSIINADVNAAAAIQQSKLAMNAATTRANATGISQADLGLASFDSGDFTITNGWVSLATAGVDLADLPNLTQYQTFGKNTVGSGTPTIVSYADVVSNGLGLEDGDFTSIIAAASDPGEALIKTGTGTYGITNVSTTGEVNSIVKSDASGIVDVQALKVDGTLLIDSVTVSNDTKFYTRGSAEFLNAQGSSANTTVLTFTGKEFAFGGLSAVQSTLAGTLATGRSEAVARGLSAPHIYTHFIESGVRETGGTGIALGTGGGNYETLPNSGPSRITMLVGGDAPFIIAADADDSSGATVGMFPDTDDVYTIGNASARYATIFATTFHGTATNALYADLAEKYRADDQYESGTVLQFGGDKEVTIAMEANTNKIAGVVTTAPAFLMNDELNEPNTVAVALQGRVPCKVIGKISKGDMLVASYMPGVACAAEGEIKMGTVIGKSLENYDSDQVGVIEIAIGR